LNLSNPKLELEQIDRSERLGPGEDADLLID
jgi:hypothetical protein